MEKCSLSVYFSQLVTKVIEIGNLILCIHSMFKEHSVAMLAMLLFQLLHVLKSFQLHTLYK